MNQFAVDEVVLGFLFAGGAHAAVMLWLLGHPARNPMKRSLCIWEAIGLLWHVGMAGCGVFKLNPDMLYLFGISEVLWFKSTHVLSVLTSMAVLSFIYSILQRKIEWVYRIWLVHLTCVSIYIVFSQMNFASYEAEEKIGVMGPLLCYFFCIGLMIYTYIKNADRQLRMRIICTVAGLGGALFLYTLFGKILPDIMQFDGTDLRAKIVIFNGGWVSSFVMIAAVRYGIVRMELDQVAEDIFTNMTDPVVLIAPEGKIMRVNPAATARFQNVFGQDTLPAINDFIPPENIVGETFETNVLTSNDQSVFTCTRSRVFVSGEDLGSILIMRDITKEKEVDRMKTELTSTVSHELRTPLTSVLGFARLIQKRFESVIIPTYEPTNRKETKAVKQIQQNLDVIISEGTRLTNLINDVLDISKMESGKLDWNMKEHDLGTVIEQSIAAASGLFARKPEVTLQQEHNDKMPILVIDADRIIQVILNLISNAVKFTDSGTVTIRSQITDSAFKVSVIDQGIGIAKADRPKVFEKYKQVGEQQQGRPKGTGLGLPISKEIVEHHEGRIWVESELGKGSSFIFTLPLQPSAS